MAGTPCLSPQSWQSPGERCHPAPHDRAHQSRPFPVSPISLSQTVPSLRAGHPVDFSKCASACQRRVWHPVSKTEITKDETGHFKVFTPSSPPLLEP